MIRIFRVYFPRRTVLLILSDILLVFIAFLVATFVHPGTNTPLQLAENRALKIFVPAMVCMLCMYYFDLYGAFLLSDRLEIAIKIAQVLGTSCLALSLLYYLYPELRLRSDHFLVALVLMSAGFVLSRWVFLAVNHLPKLTEKTVFFGSGPLTESLHAEMVAHPEFGLRPTGYIKVGPSPEPTCSGLKYLGSAEALPQIVDREGITRVVLITDRLKKLPSNDLKRRGLIIQGGSELYEAMTGKLALPPLVSEQAKLTEKLVISRSLLLYKRIASIIFSSVALMFALPVIAAAAIAIRLDSSGPVLFRQKRVGKEGKLFVLYKLRTMSHKQGTEEETQPAVPNDVRFTRVGKWLRRARIDELPQLLNILWGDMYLIGPRPFAASMELRLASSIPFYDHRWAMKPGATGWAQVRRGYCSTLEDNVEKLEYDLFYIQNVSVGLDLLIFLETIKILLLGRGSL